MQPGDDPVFFAFHKAMSRVGMYGATALLTIAAVLVSLAVTAVCLRIMQRPLDPHFLVIATAVPLVVTPLLSYLLFMLLIRLEAAEERLRSLATEDDLTHVFNRRHLISVTENEIERAKRYGNVFSLTMVAVDGFRGINESCGRLAGDKVLQMLTSTVKRQIRPVDLLARFGGAEFVILQPQTGAEDALSMARRIRDVVARTPVIAGADVLDITVCAGVTACTDPKQGLEPLFHRAEQALLDAQELGAGRVSAR
jgi:diguanylate cyclase (GGDEF)-like protein